MKGESHVMAKGDSLTINLVIDIKNVDGIQHSIQTLIKGQEKIMSILDDFNATLGRIDAATTLIGANILALLALLAAGGLSPAEEAAILARIGVQATTLEQVAADSASPVPPIPPA